MQSRLRVDGINIDHVQKMAGLSGPLMWIYSGRFDRTYLCSLTAVVADIKFPRQYGEGVDINTVLSEIRDTLNATFSGERSTSRDADAALIPGQPELSGPAILAPVTAVGPMAEKARQERAARDVATRGGQRHSDVEEPQDTHDLHDDSTSEIRQSVVIELDVRFKDIKALMPIFTRELSYSTYALVRPIVAFMNANKTLIPVKCRILMDLSEFDGSLDLSQTGLPPLVSQKIWEALANHVSSQQANHQRVRNVSLWTLSVMSQGMLRIARHLRDTIARVMPPEVPAT